jgi:predicted nucleic acid-binding protein
LRRALDTNVLVYAHIPALDHHAKVRKFLLEQLADRNTVLAVTPMVVHEFVHVITDARRFDPPVPMPEALALARRYLGRSNVECLPVDEAAMLLALDLMDRHGFGRRRIADTLLAATLLASGVHELITCNPDDFRLFETLTLLDPRMG